MFGWRFRQWKFWREYRVTSDLWVSDQKCLAGTVLLIRGTSIQGPWGEDPTISTNMTEAGLQQLIHAGLLVARWGWLWGRGGGSKGSLPAPKYQRPETPDAPEILALLEKYQGEPSIPLKGSFWGDIGGNYTEICEVEDEIVFHEEPNFDDFVKVRVKEVPDLLRFLLDAHGASHPCIPMTNARDRVIGFADLTVRGVYEIRLVDLKHCGFSQTLPADLLAVFKSWEAVRWSFADDGRHEALVASLIVSDPPERSSTQANVVTLHQGKADEAPDEPQEGAEGPVSR